MTIVHTRVRLQFSFVIALLRKLLSVYWGRGSQLSHRKKSELKKSSGQRNYGTDMHRRPSPAATNVSFRGH